jgi:hypothetical protein
MSAEAVILRIVGYAPVRLSRPDNAAEANVAGGGVDRVCVTGGWPIAATIVRRTKMGAAFEHLTRNLQLRLCGVVADFFQSATRIVGNAAGFLSPGRVVRIVPVRSPLPHVADHVE